MKKKYKYSIVCMFILLHLQGVAQNQKKLQIAVIDSITNTPIELVNVQINDSENRSVTGGLTNKEGKCLLQCKASTYDLKVTYIGYNTFVKQLKIESDTSFSILLLPSTLLLNEFKVQGQKAILENKPDRVVYNINETDQKGKRIADVMKNIPFVVVTGDILTIKGKNNFKILKNGNPSNLTIQDLRLLPSSLVESIEVITSPSSKYDGEYENVINLIMKVNTNFQGGTVLSKIGTRSSIVGGSYSKANNKFNTNISLNFSFDRLRSGSTLNRELLGDTIYNINQQEKSIRKTPSFLFRYGTEITISKTKFLGIGVKASYDKDNLVSNFQSEIKPTLETISSSNTNKTNPLSIVLNTDYSQKIGEVNKLYFSNLFTFNNSFYSLLSLNNSNQIINKNQNKNAEFSSQLDYEFTLFKSFKSEMGGKLLIRDYNLYPTYNESVGLQQTYLQKIFGSYISTSKSIKNFYFRAGIRLEYTGNKLESKKNEHLNILPNGLFSYNIKKDIGLRASYRKSLQRPGFNLLSTFINQSTPLSPSSGNPNLTNETYNLFELENYYNLESSNISFSLLYTGGNNLISSQRVVNDLNTLITYGNLSNSTQYGVSLSYNKVFVKGKFRFFSSGNISKFTISSHDQSNNGITKNINFGFSVNPVKNLSVDLFTNYLNNAVFLQGSYGNSLFMDLSIRYQHNKSFFSLQVNNPILNKINTSINGEGANFSYSGKNYYYGRATSIAYFLSFGKTKQGQKNTRELRINDVKKEEKL